jgi:hypothetical protein
LVSHVYGREKLTPPLDVPSTPELGPVQVHLSASMTYRVAAGARQHLLPADAGRSAEIFRNRTLQIGQQIGPAAADRSATAASAAAITVSVDSTSASSREVGEPHRYRVGNVETAGGNRKVFGTVGQTDDTEVTAFTDGRSSLLSVLVVCFTSLKHATQTASGLRADGPSRM